MVGAAVVPLADRSPDLILSWLDPDPTKPILASRRDVRDLL